MRLRSGRQNAGIALVVAMVAIFVLSVLIGAFALSMKVEMRLAMNANRDDDAVAEGLSGVDGAKMILAEYLKCRYDSLNQKWAGGAGAECDTNGILAEIELAHFPISEGKDVGLQITDLDGKININTADPALLQQALTVMGVDAGQIPGIASAIVDWIDDNSVVSPNGEESAYYRGLSPSYYAKDGPIDDISEVLLIRGVSPEMYPLFAENFTTLSLNPNGRVNINTAPASVLTILFSGDAEAAARVISIRNETPAGSPACPNPETLLINAGFSAPQAQQLGQRFAIRSTVFRVEVLPKGSTRKYVAVLGRNNPQDIRVLSFHWENAFRGPTDSEQFAQRSRL